MFQHYSEKCVLSFVVGVYYHLLVVLRLTVVLLYILLTRETPFSLNKMNRLTWKWWFLSIRHTPWNQTLYPS